MDVFPRDIRLRANSASGDWADLQEMLAGGSISVSNAVGQPDEAKELLSLLVNRPARKVWGAAVRWALGIGHGNDIQLQLQALPCPVSHLKKCPTLRGDNVPVMIITTFHVWCQLFDDPTAGNIEGTIYSLYTVYFYLPMYCIFPVVKFCAFPYLTANTNFSPWESLTPFSISSGPSPLPVLLPAL